MLLGRSQHSLDDKNRIVLPATHRELLQGVLYFALGDDNEVAIWPEAGFNAIMAIKKNRELTGGAEGRKEHRIFAMNASQVKMDAQFRVSIPENLRLQAGLDRGRPVSIVGVDDRVEIWDSARLDFYLGVAQ
jgi:MraZ protein